MSHNDFSFLMVAHVIKIKVFLKIIWWAFRKRKKMKKKKAIKWSSQRSIASFFILSLWAHHPTFPWSSIHLLAILSQENIIMPTDAWSHSLVSSSGSTARSFSFFSSVPGGKIRRVETNERECWLSFSNCFPILSLRPSRPYIGDWKVV